VTAHCLVCKAPVLWVLLPSRKRMAVGPAEDATGNIAVTRDGSGRYLGRHVSKAEPLMRHEHPHRPHVADCRPAAAARSQLDQAARQAMAPTKLPPGVADLTKARQQRAARQWGAAGRGRRG
jgi:hypothetical protein